MDGEAHTRPPGSSWLGVIVVHYGDRAGTERCVRSLVGDPSAVPRRIAVVDNSAAGGGALEEGSFGPGVRVLSSPDNPGFGEGANRGVSCLAATGTPAGWVVLNHDIEVLPGFLDAVHDSLGAARCGSGHGRVGAVGGPIYLDRPGGPLWSAGGEVRWLTGTVRQSRSAEDPARARDVGFLPGAAIAVAPRAWNEVGGFDPSIFLYHEDLDLCLRLRRAGWRLRFEPEMAAVHHLGAATGSASGSAFYLEHLTRTRFRPYRSRLYRVYLALAHGPYVLARAAVLVLREGGAGWRKARAVLRGYGSALGTVWHPSGSRSPRRG